MSARQDFAAAVEAANRARRHAVETAASAREAEIRVALIEADRQYARRLEKAESDHNAALMRAAIADRRVAPTRRAFRPATQAPTRGQPDDNRTANQLVGNACCQAYGLR
jgi:hypothetical protein